MELCNSWFPVLLDENKKPKTLAAIVPPNSYPGMQFFIEYQPASAHGSE